MQPLTERQQAILDFIRKAIRDSGYPPTLREIGAQMNIRSTNGVSDHLRALERKGYLRREDMKSRALRPIDLPVKKGPRLVGPEVTSVWSEDREYRFGRNGAANDVVTIPLVGRVAAGALLLAEDNIEQQLVVDASLLKSRGDTFALKVWGDSMIEAGIHNGDVLFVRRQQSAEQGEVVVALVGEEATVKRFFKDRDGFRLQPEHPTMKPIHVRGDDLANFSILGVAVGLFRPSTAFR